MKKPIVFMFSGQGSQYYQMGKDLFHNHPVFRNWMLHMDDIVQRLIGRSVLHEIYNEQRRKEEKFDRTLFTHPAIFMVEYALSQVLIESGIRPDYVLGTSLGEFTAIAVSECMSVEDVMECVIKQAEVIESHCQKSGMLAILDSVDVYHEDQLMFKHIELASVNYHSHFVVSGENERLAEVVQWLAEKNILYQLLPVSYGFHSSCMDPAEEQYRSFLRSMSFNKPVIPVISSLFGAQLLEVPNSYLWEIVRSPIQFQEALLGLEKRSGCIYLDVGPAGTLANFTKYNLAKDSVSSFYPIVTPFGQDMKHVMKIESLLR
ncbi:acyltransferase domain-containing protein [Paenibacillus hexagrammi]|uniref:Acyltransferase domain-containing protein n=1 Tax=Paenibacillus hexagrammi TaxID=2908839 RepID=A0ABY3SP51_9BACL|nr:acyltransferase domain-containing protein [Paenibacillus sp. YPD9-1]UJF34767.1 acyltransferase domain-containing protein [Paenibacillus sp. YPD9-1]